MKKRYALVSALLLGLGLFCWLRTRQEYGNVSPTSATGSVSRLQDSSAPSKPPMQRPPAPRRPEIQSSPAIAREPDVSAAVREYVQNKLADPQYDWRQPINFYGKVLDQSNEPLAGANITFVWNDMSEKGTSEANTTSDGNGLFSLNERRGKRLYVEVGKQGYYNSHQNGAFEYANPADGLFTPDPNNPVVFHLRRKGLGADLVTSQYGMSPDFPIHIPRDGTPVKIDIMQRKVGEGGQMQISETKPEYSAWKQADSWSFRIEVPDGGLAEENDEFPFEAPEFGYQPITEFLFRKRESNWAEHVNRSYYIRFGNPPRYGRFHVETSISMGGAILSYAINPDGSRNLESK